MPVYAVTPTLFVGSEVPDLAGNFYLFTEDSIPDDWVRFTLELIENGWSVVVPSSKRAHEVLTELMGAEASEAAIRLSNLWEGVDA